MCRDIKKDDVGLFIKSNNINFTDVQNNQKRKKEKIKPQLNTV